MKSVTLKDVAKAAGVSYATVSRALSGSPQIGSDTRERIIKLCDEMGYTTNYVARSMVMKKTDLIGLVVPSIDNQFMSELAYYAEMSARAHGYNIMLCNSGPDLKQEKTVVKLLLGRQVDGILIVPRTRIPMKISARSQIRSPRCSSRRTCGTSPRAMWRRTTATAPISGQDTSMSWDTGRSSISAAVTPPPTSCGRRDI